MSADQPGTVVLLTAMVSELRPLVRRLGLRRSGGDGVVSHRGAVAGRSVAAGLTGIGTTAAAEATRSVLSAEATVDHVVMVGIAGAVDPELEIGAVIVPEEVVDESGATFRPVQDFGRRRRGRLLTTDALYNRPEDLDRLRADGVVAVDMETAAVAGVCEERSTPWSVLRAISDRAGDPLTDGEVVGLADEDGSADVRAVVRWVARRPWRVGHLLKLARGMTRATNAAAAGAAAALSDL